MEQNKEVEVNSEHDAEIKVVVPQSEQPSTSSQYAEQHELNVEEKTTEREKVNSEHDAEIKVVVPQSEQPPTSSQYAKQKLNVEEITTEREELEKISESEKELLETFLSLLSEKSEKEGLDCRSMSELDSQSLDKHVDCKTSDEGDHNSSSDSSSMPFNGTSALYLNERTFNSFHISRVGELEQLLHQLAKVKFNFQKLMETKFSKSKDVEMNGVSTDAKCESDKSMESENSGGNPELDLAEMKEYRLKVSYWSLLKKMKEQIAEFEEEARELFDLKKEKISSPESIFKRFLKLGKEKQIKCLRNVLEVHESKLSALKYYSESNRIIFAEKLKELKGALCKLKEEASSFQTIRNLFVQQKTENEIALQEKERELAAAEDKIKDLEFVIQSDMERQSELEEAVESLQLQLSRTRKTTWTKLTFFKQILDDKKELYKVGSADKTFYVGGGTETGQIDMPDIGTVEQLEIQNENEVDRALTGGIAGVARFEGMIYVICNNSKNVRAFLDEKPYNEVDVDIKVRKLGVASDMVASREYASLFIADTQLECLWRIQVSNNFTRTQMSMQGLRGKLSVTPFDEVLAVAWRFHITYNRYCFYIFLTRNGRLRQYTQLPLRMKIVWHAVQLWNSNFIVSYQSKDSGNLNLISELSSVVDCFIVRTFEPRPGDNIFTRQFQPFYLAVDEYGHVFVADYHGLRIVVLDYKLADYRVLMESLPQEIGHLSRIYYTRDRRQLVVGHGGLVMDTQATVSFINLNP